MNEITDEMMHGALDRIARTPDGEMFYRWLQKRLMGVPADVGALPQEHGARMLASSLMGLMTQGMQDTHAGRTDVAITFAVAKPVAVTSAGAHRRGATGRPDFQSEFDDPRRPPVSS